MSTKETIRLNGHLYSSENVEKLNENAADAWRKDIYLFLKSWFDSSEAVTVHTSGSTGVPKEISLSKAMMRHSARITNAFFALDSSKTALLCIPVSYIAGKMMLVRALVGGFNLLLTTPRANPFDNVQFAVDFTAITPYQLHHSLESLKKTDVKNVIVGGGRVNSTLEMELAQIPTAMYETYGMTETASHVALRRLNGSSKSDCFTVLNGASISQDARGCLVIKAPHLSDNEFVTNDVVEIIGDTFFRWLGRADLVINSGGIKIFPEQVEKKLEHLINTPYFIAALPDNKLENKVVLVLESDTYPAAAETDLMRQMQRVLQKYELPKQIFYLPKFIYSAGNKIRKGLVMQELSSNSSL